MSDQDRIAAAREGLEAMEFLGTLTDSFGPGSPEVESVRADVKRTVFAAIAAGITSADIRAAARRDTA